MSMEHARSFSRCLVLGVAVATGWQTAGPLFAETEQTVEVTIKDFKFVTQQPTLRLGAATTIRIHNEDAERHDFGSTMFEGIPTQIQKDGVIVYGRGVEGVLLDPTGAAQIHFNMSRPGRHEFRCSIHPDMKGELLLLNVEAV